MFMCIRTKVQQCWKIQRFGVDKLTDVHLISKEVFTATLDLMTVFYLVTKIQYDLEVLL